MRILAPMMAMLAAAMCFARAGAYATGGDAWDLFLTVSYAALFAVWIGMAIEELRK